MSQHSSYTSSSSLAFGWRVAPLLVIAGWMIASLATIDVFIDFAFPYPRDPKVLTPTRLQQYFEYGRSAEGALRRMTRADPATTAPITLAGWYDPLLATQWGVSGQVPLTAKPDKPVVTIYGASHSVRLAAALGRVSKDLISRSVGAPGATPNWAYGAYLRDRGGGASVAVVLTFNANELAMITSFSPSIWSGDFPMPYAGDRFYIEGGELKTIRPPYDSFKSYQQTFFDPKAWAAAVDFFARNDPLYDAFSFRANVLDYSVLARLVRRAYNQNHTRANLHEVLDKSGFHPESQGVQVARALIHAFATQARTDGMIPVIYLVNNLGYSDLLFRALQPALAADKVVYVSSHTLVSPDDPSAYLPDSHFTDVNDDRLATAIAQAIKAAM